MAKVKEAKLSIHEQIIESAGQIYNYLNSKGEVSISKHLKYISTLYLHLRYSQHLRYNRNADSKTILDSFYFLYQYFYIYGMFEKYNNLMLNVVLFLFSNFAILSILIYYLILTIKRRGRGISLSRFF